MLVRLTHPKDCTIARRSFVLEQVQGIFYPFGMKALAWGWDVRINEGDYEELKGAFKTQDLELIESNTPDSFI